MCFYINKVNIKYNQQISYRAYILKYQSCNFSSHENEFQ